jgi:hypothetical protein
MTEQLGLFDGSNAHDPAQTRLNVRESTKARRLSLRLLPPHTLELVVPRGTKPSAVQAFVTQHRGWIARAREEIAASRGAGSDRLPENIELASVGRTWEVRYRHAPALRPRCCVVAELLEVRTRDRDLGSARAVLRAWLLDQAKAHLPPLLLRQAQIVGRRPKSVQIRLQKTRWGSCSGSGNISLNAGLLFLDGSLVRYLLIHELCHLFSLNHSERFWKYVEEFEPDYRVLDRRLTAAWAQVPLWVHVA